MISNKKKENISIKFIRNLAQKLQLDEKHIFICVERHSLQKPNKWRATVQHSCVLTFSAEFS